MLEAQGVIRFTGRVVSKQTGEPLIGVNITDIKLRRALAVTDEDGRFFHEHADWRTAALL